MKFGESSKETAIREIREELGINLSEKDIKLTNETAVVVHSHGLLLRYQYAVTKIDDRLKLSLSSEITDTKWVKTKEVNLPETVEAYLL
jgi:8-oxo-dGTP pyrophosphatase MutT (NUDIX family)